MNPDVRIAVVGATGVVGREIAGLLAERGVSAEKVTLLASERSEGAELEYGNETLEVEPARSDGFRGIQVALFAVPPDVARGLAPAAQAAGAWAVDVSATFRSDPSVPLVLPGLERKGAVRPSKGRIVACPSATTTGLALALEPLWRFGLEEVQVTALVGSSSAGGRGISELERQTADLLTGRELEPAVFPHRLAFNLLPQVGAFEGAEAAEERAVGLELRRLWEGRGREVAVGATAVQVPTFYGELLTITAQLSSRPSVEAVQEALKASSALKLLDDPAARVYPMPMLVTGDVAVHVGRVRHQGARGVSLVACLDNALRGAAYNAVEVGQALSSAP
jgi:aspartate-semialdehyde dehydrogenase